MAEGIADCLACFVIIAIANIDAFPIFGVFLSESVLGNHIVIVHGPAFRQLTGRACLAGEQIGRSFAAGLPGKAHIQNGLYLICPGKLHGAAAQQHHNRIGIGGCHGIYQCIIALRQTHMLPVKGFGFVAVRQTHHTNRDFMLLCGGCGFLQLRLCDHSAGIAAGNIGCIGHGLRDADHLCGVDVAAAAALIAEVFCHGANQYHVRFPQRQYMILVFQKDGTLLRYRSCQFMVSIPIDFRLNNVLTLFYQTQNPLHGGIHIRF